MSQPHVYEGTLDEIILRYGKELNGHRLKVIAEKSDSEAKEVKRPFYETASPEEWSRALREWATSHDAITFPLSDEAIDRESIYEGRGE